MTAVKDTEADKGTEVDEGFTEMTDVMKINVPKSKKVGNIGKIKIIKEIKSLKNDSPIIYSVSLFHVFIL